MKSYAYTITSIDDPYTVYDTGKPPLRADIDGVIFEVERTNEYADAPVDVVWQYDRDEIKWRDLVYSFDGAESIVQYPEGNNRYSAVSPDNFPIEVGPVRINCNPLELGDAIDTVTYRTYPEWVSCPECGSAAVDTLAGPQREIGFQCVDCGEGAGLSHGETRVDTTSDTERAQHGPTDLRE